MFRNIAVLHNLLYHLVHNQPIHCACNDVLIVHIGGHFLILLYFKGRRRTPVKFNCLITPWFRDNYFLRVHCLKKFFALVDQMTLCFLVHKISVTEINHLNGPQIRLLIRFGRKRLDICCEALYYTIKIRVIPTEHFINRIAVFICR